MAAAFAVARGDRARRLRRRPRPALTGGAPIASACPRGCLFVATVVAAIHVALGLVFDPRYKDFPLASLSGPVVALAIVAFASAAGPSPARRRRDRGGDRAHRLGALHHRQ